MPAVTSLLFNNPDWLPAVGTRVLKNAPLVAGDLLAGHALGELAQNRRVSPAHVMALVACHITPQVLAQSSRVFETRWRIGLTQKLDAHTLQSRYNQPIVWASGRAAAGGRTPELAEGMPWLAQTLPADLCQTAETVGALAVQLSLLALLVDTRLAACLAASVFTSAALGFCLQKMLVAPPPKNPANDPHTTYTQVRRHIWDNVTLGNAYNKQRWQQAFENAAANMNWQWLKKDAALNLANGIGHAAGAALFAALLLHEINQRWNAGEQQAVLTTVLPLAGRAAALLGQAQQALGSAYDLLTHTNVFSDRLVALSAQSSWDPATTIGRRVRITDARGRKIFRSHLLTARHKIGHYTVHGPNNSGKNSLLLAAKQQLGESAFYWPGINALMFDVPVGSSGQTTHSAMQQLERDLPAHPKITTVLFFKAGANLDDTNRAALRRLQNRLAKTMRVISVSP